MSIFGVHSLVQVVFINFQKSYKRHLLKILSNPVHDLHDVRDLVQILAADDDDGAGIRGAECGRSPEQFSTDVALACQSQLWIENLSVKTEI